MKALFMEYYINYLISQYYIYKESEREGFDFQYLIEKEKKI